MSEQTAPASPYSVVILTPGPSAGSVSPILVLAEWLNNFAAPDGRLPALMEVDDNPLISGVAVVPVDAAAAAQVLAAIRPSSPADTPSKCPCRRVPQL